MLLVQHRHTLRDLGVVVLPLLPLSEQFQIEDRCRLPLYHVSLVLSPPARALRQLSRSRTMTLLVFVLASLLPHLNYPNQP